MCVSFKTPHDKESGAVDNGERGSRRQGQVAKVVCGRRREEPSAEDGGRKVTVLDGFFAPEQRGKMGETGLGHDAQLRERGGGLVRYDVIKRGGSGGRQDA
jgi:hypothetical protein